MLNLPMGTTLSLLLGLCHLWLSSSNEYVPLTCSVLDESEIDPALKKMTYNVGDGEQTMLAYVEPDINSFCQGVGSPSRKFTPNFVGLVGKFINMSNETIHLFWEKRAHAKHPQLMNTLTPFGVAPGTATYQNHHFFFATDAKNPQSSAVARFKIGRYPRNLYFYDPYCIENDQEATEENLAQLTFEERDLYNQWKVTLDFSNQYLNFTGRSYLANYLRKPPENFMWKADYFGQQQFVTTRETHFVKLPPENELQWVTEHGTERILKPEDPRLLENYRLPDQSRLNLTLTAISCSPRVFEIPNFLSQVEVDHILKLAGGIKLKRSHVGAGDGISTENRKRSTRTSFNSWIAREQSPIMDAIYRRAADLLRIDEALFRTRGPGEFEEKNFKSSITERLQLVHYGIGQEYSTHQDFGFPALNTRQGARFATLLLYLNEGMKGGETSFPRWVNTEAKESMKVTPVEGKAVLFYSQLPDGNFDDFSRHAALPVIEGEKWLVNLWVWDPFFREGS